MKTTSLSHKHIELGAKMVEFAGYQMPIQYSGIKDEHMCVRNQVGVFDVSHMGEFIIKGKGALELVQWVSSNDAAKLTPGKIQYAYLPNETGGVIDDMLVYCLEDGVYMLVVNASNIEKDWNWIKSQNKFGAEMHNISDKTTLLAVQGPNATKLLQHFTDFNLDDVKYYNFVKGKFAGEENVLISATGYTGAGGFEIYFENNAAENIWNELMKQGENYGLKPCGLGARDTLRLEMGYCLYGNDIDDTTSPLEAGLGWTTKFTKEFVNSTNLKNQKEQGVANKLVGFEMPEKKIPRQGYEIKNADGSVIGKVTSGSLSPMLNRGIGMGYVPKELSKEGSTIYIDIRGKLIEAEVIK
ncbi:MAG: glycine cleavage system aminomethyltransferase GcvT, partial [Bacteroidia bacterium]|nr:glycine cleavage system aminomethyltransferase GcvT [Bacteroidia bacterium]